MKWTGKDCIAKRLYDAGTPYIQILGFIILTAFTAGAKWTKVDAYDARITALESFQQSTGQQIADINGKLDVMLNFWGIKEKGRNP